MNKFFYILFCIFITSCSTKHYINLSDEEVKNISIPKNYKVIYCNCNNNPLQLTIIDKLKKIGIKIIKINDYSRINEIDSKKSIVIYGYSKKINGSSIRANLHASFGQSLFGYCFYTAHDGITGKRGALCRIFH